MPNAEDTVAEDPTEVNFVSPISEVFEEEFEECPSVECSAMDALEAGQGGGKMVRPPSIRTASRAGALGTGCAASCRTLSLAAVWLDLLRLMACWDLCRPLRPLLPLLPLLPPPPPPPLLLCFCFVRLRIITGPLLPLSGSNR